MFLFCTIALAVSRRLTRPPLHTTQNRILYLMLIFVHDSAEEAFFFFLENSGDSIELDVNGIVCVEVTQRTRKMQSGLVRCVSCRANGPLINYKLKISFHTNVPPTSA